MGKIRVTTSFLISLSVGVFILIFLSPYGGGGGGVSASAAAENTVSDRRLSQYELNKQSENTSSSHRLRSRHNEKEAPLPSPSSFCSSVSHTEYSSARKLDAIDTASSTHQNDNDAPMETLSLENKEKKNDLPPVDDTLQENKTNDLSPSPPPVSSPVSPPQIEQQFPVPPSYNTSAAETDSHADDSVTATSTSTSITTTPCEASPLDELDLICPPKRHPPPPPPPPPPPRRGHQLLSYLEAIPAGNDNNKYLTQAYPTSSDSSSGSTDRPASDPAWSQEAQAARLSLHAVGNIAEDMEALSKLIRFADERVEALKRDGRDITPYYKSSVDETGGLNPRSAFSSAASLTKEQVFRNIQSAMKRTRQSITEVNPEINFYAPVWEESNIQNTGIDCAVSKCILTLRRNVDKQKIVVSSDATGSLLGSPPELQKEFRDDARRGQYVMKDIERIAKFIKIYNEKADVMSKHEQYKPRCAPKLKLFLEIVKYKVDAVAPFWLWNYSIRAYVQMSVTCTFPIYGFSHFLTAYTGDSSKDQALSLFDWTEQDEIDNVIGRKPVYALSSMRNTRDPVNMYYTDAYALCMEGLFRAAKVFKDLELRVVDSNLTMTGFIVSQGVVQKDEPWTGDKDMPELALELSCVTMTTFPALLKVEKGSLE